MKHEVAESRARLHAHSEIERTLRAQLEAARAEVERSHEIVTREVMSPDTSQDTSQDKSSLVTCDAACDPVSGEMDEYFRFSPDEELSTDANELAAEVRICLNTYCCLI